MSIWTSRGPGSRRSNVNWRRGVESKAAKARALLMAGPTRAEDGYRERSMLRSRSLRALLMAASVALAAPSARADDPAAAQALFNDAKRLMSAGKYPDACPKLEESERLPPGRRAEF